jgi:hypothetical protein
MGFTITYADATASSSTGGSITRDRLGAGRGSRFAAIIRRNWGISLVGSKMIFHVASVVVSVCSRADRR